MSDPDSPENFTTQANWAKQPAEFPPSHTQKIARSSSNAKERSPKDGLDQIKLLHPESYLNDFLEDNERNQVASV